MSILEEGPFVERFHFFNGQRLFAADLQGLEAFNREMRWLHNRTLHQAGIGSGFAVTGKKGDRQITIGPGYAVDAPGREIVLTRPYVTAVPPVAAEPSGESVIYDLTVSYPDDASLDVVETRDGVCLPRGAVRLREAPVFCFVRLERDEQGTPQPPPALQQSIRERRQIVVARLEVLQCQLSQDVSIAQRLNARPPRQPYIASGEAVPAWQLEGEKITVSAALKPVLVRAPLRATIDTSAAGFQTVPSYTTTILGPRRRIAGGTTFIVDGVCTVVGARVTAFDLEITLVVESVSGKGAINVQAELFEDWRVTWMGVET